MKCNILLAAAFIAIPAMAQTVDQTPEDNKGGKIVVFRTGAIMGASVACPVRHEGTELFELGRGRYASIDVPAGRYLLTNKTSSAEVSVSDNETRYVQCQIKAGFMSGRADLRLSDAATFAEHEAKLKLVDEVRGIPRSNAEAE